MCTHDIGRGAGDRVSPKSTFCNKMKFAAGEVELLSANSTLSAVSQRDWSTSLDSHGPGKDLEVQQPGHGAQGGPRSVCGGCTPSAQANENKHRLPS
jgi:hypothetical protein